MKTPEEVKKGLKCCRDNVPCIRCEYYKNRDHRYTCQTDLFADVIAYIERLEAQVPKWISVEERLPDDIEEVLILVKETEFYGQYKELSKSYFCQYIGCVDDGEWFTVWCHGHRYIKDTAKEPCADKLEVTHWMPLPEGPKEG